MYRKIKCLLCGEDTKVVGKATIMPFIMERLYSIKDYTLPTNMRYCGACSFYFFEHRLDQMENKFLYKNYMGEDYIRQRERTEFYFDYVKYKRSDIINYNKYLWRITEFNRIMHPFADKIDSVLDYGCSDCWHILDGKKFDNYDIDNQETKLKNNYDLIVMSNVIEHMAEPIKEIERIKFKYLYIEVPCHLPFMVSMFQKRTLQQLFIDMYKIIKFNSFFQMHEHVSFFTPRAVKLMLNKLNCDTVYFKKTDDSLVAIGKRR